MVSVQGPAAARAAAGLGSDTSIALDDPAQAYLHLSALHRKGTLLELRAKQERGMAQFFSDDPRFAGSHAVKASRQTDVYVGVLPRLRESGGKDALPPTANVVWCEADTEAAMLRALDFTPRAPLVIRSSPGKAHFYWFLRDHIGLTHIERANRRLAWHLGGDLRACDAARILRVAGTRNWKRGEPTRVAIIRFEPQPNVPSLELVGHLPDPTPPQPIRVTSTPRPVDVDTERLRDIPARVYIPALCGREVYHGFVQCPWHKGGGERTPSLSVGGPRDELFLCFGCQEGGDIFTFAARMWGLDEKRDFVTLKSRLRETLR